MEVPSRSPQAGGVPGVPLPLQGLCAVVGSLAAHLLPGGLDVGLVVGRQHHGDFFSESVQGLEMRLQRRRELLCVGCWGRALGGRTHWLSRDLGVRMGRTAGGPRGPRGPSRSQQALARRLDPRVLSLSFVVSHPPYPCASGSTPLSAVGAASLPWHLCQGLEHPLHQWALPPKAQREAVRLGTPCVFILRLEQKPGIERPNGPRAKHLLPSLPPSLQTPIKIPPASSFGTPSLGQFQGRESGGLGVEWGTGQAA